MATKQRRSVSSSYTKACRVPGCIRQPTSAKRMYLQSCVGVDGENECITDLNENEYALFRTYTAQRSIDKDVNRKSTDYERKQGPLLGMDKQRHSPENTF